MTYVDQQEAFDIIMAQRDKLPLQVSVTTFTPLYQPGRFSAGSDYVSNDLGPWSWVSVYGEPGTNMLASLPPGPYFVESLQSSYSAPDFRIPDTYRAEFRVRWPALSARGPQQRYNGALYVQGLDDPNYNNDPGTSFMFFNYSTPDTNSPNEFMMWARSDNAPVMIDDDLHLTLKACCSIYVVISPVDKPYPYVAVDLSHYGGAARIPGRPDNKVPLTTSGPYQYAMIDIQYFVQSGTTPTTKQITPTLTLPDSPIGSFFTPTVHFFPFGN